MLNTANQKRLQSVSLYYFYAKGARKMSHMGFVKGLITGAAVGTAAMLLFDPVTPRQRRRVKKQACAAFRSMGRVMDDLNSMRK